MCAGLAALTLRIDVRFVAARLAASVLVDVVWTVLRGRRLGASPDATAIAFATLIAFHVVAFGGAVTGERMARTRFAIHRALEAAVRDRRALLDDLFPPAVVQARRGVAPAYPHLLTRVPPPAPLLLPPQSLLAGDPVPPLVSEGAVVLFCDFAGGWGTPGATEVAPFCTAPSFRRLGFCCRLHAHVVDAAALRSHARCAAVAAVGRGPESTLLPSSPPVVHPWQPWTRSTLRSTGSSRTRRGPTTRCGRSRR